MTHAMFAGTLSLHPAQGPLALKNPFSRSGLIFILRLTARAARVMAAYFMPGKRRIMRWARPPFIWLVMRFIISLAFSNWRMS